jgi:hypothetical protein
MRTEQEWRELERVLERGEDRSEDGPVWVTDPDRDDDDDDDDDNDDNGDDNSASDGDSDSGSDSGNTETRNRGAAAPVAAAAAAATSVPFDWGGLGGVVVDSSSVVPAHSYYYALLGLSRWRWGRYTARDIRRAWRRAVVRLFPERAQHQFYFDSGGTRRVMTVAQLVPVPVGAHGPRSSS